MTCSRCAGRCIVPTSGDVVRLNMVLDEHALCMWGDGWEICVTKGVNTAGGRVIRNKAGDYRGTMWELS